MSFPKITDTLSAALSPRGTPRAVEERPRPHEAEAPEAPPARRMADEERTRITERLQELARASGRDLEFRVDEASDRVVISVRDQRTGELIRQIPDETALRIAERLTAQMDDFRSVLIEDKA